jgi:hypothetical protein
VVAASSAISLRSFVRCKNRRRMLGSVVVSAVRWHSVAFLRQRRTGSVSLDDLSK